MAVTILQPDNGVS